jgi:UDP-glucuronate 4-epimerase
MRINNSVLVTGGAGFIGSHLCEDLLRKGYRVICLDSFTSYYNPLIKENNISDIFDEPGFYLSRTDIRNKNDLEILFERTRPDLVIHLAAMPGVRPSIENPFLFYDINVTGTLMLLETMKKFGVRDMIFASSSSVYGNNNKVPFSESDPVDKQISPYASSKRAGELICYTYHSLYKFNIFCLRFFTVFGPRQRPDLAIHKFADLIIENKPIQIFGDGQTIRDYTYIADVIQGINHSISHLKGFEIFNIGESHTISLIEMVETLEKAIGKNAIKEYFPMQQGDVERTYADISKAKNQLGYDPGYSFKEGIAHFVKWKTLESLRKIIPSVEPQYHVI